VWTNIDAEPTPWAEVAAWETGLLSLSDWDAKWIEPKQRPAQSEPLRVKQFEDDINPLSNEVRYDLLRPAEMVCKSFNAKRSIAKARIYATARGVYELELNGHRVGDWELAPEYTSYDRYLMYQTYHVTGLLHEGSNALGAGMQGGWL
jgi:alpha-L-rhamnosidase